MTPFDVEALPTDSRDALDLVNSIGLATRPDDVATTFDQIRSSLSFDYLSFVRVALTPDVPLFEEVSMGRKLMGMGKDYLDRELHRNDPTLSAVLDRSGMVISRDYVGNAAMGAGDAWSSGISDLYRNHGLEMQGALRIDTAETDNAVILMAGSFDARDATVADRNARAMQGVLRLASLAYLDALDGIGGGGRHSRHLLSRAEADVLERLASGATPQEVSSDTGKSVSTVRKQMESARKRLGARTTLHAVSIARSLQLIAPR